MPPNHAAWNERAREANQGDETDYETGVEVNGGGKEGQRTAEENVKEEAAGPNLLRLQRALDESRKMSSSKRPRADLNRDRWIQSPEC